MKAGFFHFAIECLPVNAGAFHDDDVRLSFLNPLDKILAFIEISANCQKLVVDLLL